MGPPRRSMGRDERLAAATAVVVQHDGIPISSEMWVRGDGGMGGGADPPALLPLGGTTF